MRASPSKLPPAKLPTSAAEVSSEAPEGYIREDHATQLWNEREHHIQTLITEAVAAALSRQQGHGSAAPSEAPAEELQNPADLEGIDHYADDDSSWATLDKGKRKALVNRERGEMAGKLKCTLLRRLGRAETPFKGVRKAIQKEKEAAAGAA
jgi:hypothetical protein